MRSPALFPIATVYGYGLLAALAILAALGMPGAGVSVRAAPVGSEVMVGGARVGSFPDGAVAGFAAGGSSLRIPLEELVPDYSPRGDARAVSRWFDTRSQLATLIARPGARMVLPDGRALDLRDRSRRLVDLPIDSWLLLAQGALLSLLGAWLATVRGRDPGVRLFTLSCAGIAATSLSGAVFDARELAANGVLLHAMQTINFAGTCLGSAALGAVFAVQPRALVSQRTAFVAVLAATSWGAAAGIGWLPLGAFYLGLLTLLVASVLVLGVQAIRCRADPAALATLRWVGVTTLLGAGQVTVAMSVPKLFGLPDIGGDGATIVPLALVYGGIAFGIGRHRLFELDRWTYRVVLGGAAVLALLLIDGALVAAFDLDRPVALVLALAAAGYLYLPVRALVWRRVMGEERLADGEKFQLATGVAYAPSAEARRAGWRVLLQRLFEPLSVEPAAGPVSAVALAEGGAALLVPAVADEAPLRLAFRAHGTRLFGRDQLRLAEEMVALMRRADATRAEYARGVGEERQRIARDLHDDVCAVLLTSLHRDDVAKVRGDVRNAMADIRTMIGELTGERVTLDRALADLRFETAERLTAAGLTLDWPVSAEPYPVGALDYSTFRALVSSVREAISNALKHARATRVTVAVGVRSGRLTLTIADDGVGLREGLGGGGRGLANMAARMAAVGGSFGVEARGGTVVTLAMPLGRGAVPPGGPREPGMGLLTGTG